MLIAQALSNQLTVITRDDKFEQDKVSLLGA
jgi:PIN domain nuclease of toxin-antitoxin system